MKYKLLLLSIIVFWGYSIFGNSKPIAQKKNKTLSEKNKSEGFGNELKKILLKGEELGSLWTIKEEESIIIFSPDSMRQASVYHKYIFDLNEFRKAGGKYKADSRINIYYNILKTSSENYTPKDTNAPSPSGGFTYIIHKCKINKIEEE